MYSRLSWIGSLRQVSPNSKIRKVQLRRLVHINSQMKSLRRECGFAGHSATIVIFTAAKPGVRYTRKCTRRPIETLKGSGDLMQEP